MRKWIAFLLIVIICLSFYGCSNTYKCQRNANDGFDIGFSKIKKDAYVSSYHWDGDKNNMTIAIPEEYDGLPITALGGFHGKGVPDPFCIELPDAYKSALSSDVNYWGWTSMHEYISSVETVYLNFDVHISKNIESIASDSVLNCVYYGEYFEVERHDVKVGVVFLYAFTCDEENKTFYAKDGKLYYRENDNLVSNILYFDYAFNSK